MKRINKYTGIRIIIAKLRVNNRVLAIFRLYVSTKSSVWLLCVWREMINVCYYALYLKYKILRRNFICGFKTASSLWNKTFVNRIRGNIYSIPIQFIRHATNIAEISIMEFILNNESERGKSFKQFIFTMIITVGAQNEICRCRFYRQRAYLKKTSNIEYKYNVRFRREYALGN